MEDQTVHVIIGWRCKTEDCGMFHFAKYIGEKGKIPDGTAVPLNAAGRTYFVSCPKCHQRHGYDPKEIRYMEVVGPRPAGLQDLM
jgi:hypothetical protein